MGYICMQVGIRTRAALVQAVTNKAFRLNSVRADQAASIVNFVSSDIQKLYDGAMVRPGAAATCQMTGGLRMSTPHGLNLFASTGNKAHVLP
jgi:hypothetical protein